VKEFPQGGGAAPSSFDGSPPECGSVQKRGKERGRKSWLNNAMGLAPIVLLICYAVFWFVNREPAGIALKYGELKQVLQDKTVAFQKVGIAGSDVRGEIVTRDRIADGDQNDEHTRTVPFRTSRRGVENDQELVSMLDKKTPAYQGEDEESPFKQVVSMLAPLMLMVAVVFGGFLVVRWVMGGNSPLTFGRSRHKLYALKDLHVTFCDVAGIDEAVAELREVVEFLQTPEKYQALGGRIPKGVLLVGPPGTGKTLLAKAVAGEAEAPFFSLSGSDFVEMFVGVGAARVRDLFAQAENNAPCIIFIDELDALGKTRAGSVVGGHDEREQTLNQLLVEMDGFDSNRGVIIMAATNRPETLDAALLRPGRFDRTVVVDRPDIVGREAILKVHVRNVRLAPDVDLRHVASLTPGSVGADLANLVNEAALMAARGGKEAVSMADFEEAVERGAVGLQRKSRIMQDDEKQRVAYHEAGHALVACSLPNTHPVHKVSIIPRGVGALGYVLRRPEDDRYLVTQSELESHIKVALGGTLTEELIFREISNGATSDLEKASSIARSMVKEFGMSRLGRVHFREQPPAAFLPGSPWADGEHGYSEQTAREIDVEVAKIIEDATEEVRTILQARRPALEAVAQRLMEKEVIDGSELRQLLEQHDPGPRLVPGTLALEKGEIFPEDQEPLVEERGLRSTEGR
jgi:cell division protease FtsH